MRGKRRFANRRASSTFTNNGRLDPNIARPSGMELIPIPAAFAGHVRLRLGCLAIGTRDDDRVTVEVLDPELAVTGPVALTFGRIPMRRHHHRCAELCRALHDLVEVLDLAEPNEDAVASWEGRITDLSVVVF